MHDSRETSMKTSELCRRDVVTASAGTTLTELSRMMRTNHVGSVVVTGTGERKPLGIVTDRDIVVEVLAMGLDPGTVTAGDIMTTAPAISRQGDDALWALKIMRDRGVRRLPVVDDKGDLAGILAFDDLMQHVGTTLGDIAQVIGAERVVEGWRRP
jgi:CBS domain-containing protein